MKRTLMDILVCPECKGDLDLNIAVEKNGEILEGSLTCNACDQLFPIEESIPNLLPQDMRS